MFSKNFCVLAEGSGLGRAGGSKTYEQTSAHNSFRKLALGNSTWGYESTT
jgi:hypothetical protein